MNDDRRSRRDFVKAIGGALGGISLLARSGTAAQALASLPSGYRFYRILTAGQDGTGLFNFVGSMTGSMMMASPLSGGPGYIYLHGQTRGGANALFQINVNYDASPPVVTQTLPVATETLTIAINGSPLTIEHIGVGASNALGEYVTTMQPSGAQNIATAPGLFLYTPGTSAGSWRRVITFADQAPDGSYYGGDFGDVAVDDDENLLLVAATTHAPAAAESGFSGSQALVSTSLAGGTQGRVVFRTGDLLPYVPAAVRSIGLVDLASNNSFAAQVTANNFQRSSRPGTALVVGNTQRSMAEHRLVAASPSVLPPQLASLLNVSSGDTYMGARVDPQQDLGFVTHMAPFEPSIGGNDIQELGYFSRRLRRLGRTQPLSIASDDVVSYNAPCISDTGLVFETELLGDGTNQLTVSDGSSSNVLLRSGDQVPGVSPAGPLSITEIFFGQHATQVDRFGRLAFTAEFQISSDPNLAMTPANYITALVVGIPV